MLTSHQERRIAVGTVRPHGRYWGLEFDWNLMAKLLALLFVMVEGEAAIAVLAPGALGRRVGPSTRRMHSAVYCAALLLLRRKTSSDGPAHLSKALLYDTTMSVIFF